MLWKYTIFHLRVKDIHTNWQQCKRVSVKPDKATKSKRRLIQTFEKMNSEKAQSIFSIIHATLKNHHRLFRERRAIARACTHAHAHLEMSRRAKNCPPNKQQIARLECFYFIQA